MNNLVLASMMLSVAESTKDLLKTKPKPKTMTTILQKGKKNQTFKSTGFSLWVSQLYIIPRLPIWGHWKITSFLNTGKSFLVTLFKKISHCNC